MAFCMPTAGMSAPVPQMVLPFQRPGPALEVLTIRERFLPIERRERAWRCRQQPSLELRVPLGVAGIRACGALSQEQDRKGVSGNETSDRPRLLAHSATSSGLRHTLPHHEIGSRRAGRNSRRHRGDKSRPWTPRRLRYTCRNRKPPQIRPSDPAIFEH